MSRLEPTDRPSTFESLIRTLPALKEQHSPASAVYPFLKQVARREVESRFQGCEPCPQEFGPFGDLVFPYHRMGAVDSLNLFDLDELIIFSLYWANRVRYNHVLDVGANIGLHSILLSKCGMEVRAYEPDPDHFKILTRNLDLNGCVNVEPVNAAISSKTGEEEFVRVLGNTTGSHLAGSKPNPYGELHRFPVRVEPIQPLMDWADLIKLDAEGHEKEILLATNRHDWDGTDAIVEVSSESNAAALYEHFRSLGVSLLAQKSGWGCVKCPADMPASYRDGSLFITRRQQDLWS